MICPMCKSAMEKFKLGFWSCPECTMLVGFMDIPFIYRNIIKDLENDKRIFFYVH